VAIPKVFVSSTCYDLKYIRENLKYFIKTLGYEPILSEEGSVYYDPTKHVQDSCLSEVPNCQLLVLIIGGRFGAQYKETGKSITNLEYEAAIRAKIPVFALIEEAAHADYRVFLTNLDNPHIDKSKIRYPSVDSVKIFAFIDEVKANVINNALQPFKDFGDIESYLRQQWAGMMFSFLTRRNEDKRVSDTLSELSLMNDRIQFLSGQILASVGTDVAKVKAELYELMLEYLSTKSLIDLGFKPDPKTIVANDGFEKCAEALGKASGKKLTIVDSVDFITTGSGEIDRKYLNSMSKDYEKMRQQMLKLLADRHIDSNRILSDGK